MNKLILIWYYIETRWTILLKLFKIRKNKSVIPKGMYCYIIDEEREKVEPHKNGGYWIKPCKYYRSTKKTKGIACTYLGHYGFDFCLYDQCKICGENDELDERDLK